MTTMFWILWFFIAFLVVLVAFTLRKENQDMPRRDILRAVESTGKMGVAERSFLWVFSWLDTRFRLQDYWNMSKGAYYNMHRQMPLTHAEKYKLRIIWYWYPPLLPWRNFLPFIHYLGHYRNRAWNLLCSRRRRRSISRLCEHGIHHDTTSLWLHPPGGSPLDDPLHGCKRLFAHVPCLLYRCIPKPT